MIARAGSGWQTTLADLSLILFMATGAALSDTPAVPDQASSQILPALGQPVAVWRDAAGSPSLHAWLASAGGDPNLRLTIVAPARDAAAALALAQGAGRPARLVLEPDGQGVLATLTYDQPPALARSLQSDEARPAL